MNQKTMNGSSTSSGRWIGFRKELKVLDCTIRDGGLMNSSKFSDEEVRAVYDACADAGIDYIELGYKNSDKIFSPEKYGAWRFCREDDINRIIGDNKRDIKISVMADAEKSDYKNDILPKEKSPIDLVRIATYIHQIPLAIDMIKDAKDKGYETTVNIMAVSTVRESELDEGLEMLGKSGQLRVALQRADTLHDGKVHARCARIRQGNRHSRTQQPAAGFRKYNRGDYRGREYD